MLAFLSTNSTILLQLCTIIEHRLLIYYKLLLSYQECVNLAQIGREREKRQRRLYFNNIYRKSNNNSKHILMLPMYNIHQVCSPPLPL